MKRYTIVLLLLVITFSLAAKKKSSVRLNGRYDTMFSAIHARTYPDMKYGEFNWNWSNSANLRIKTRIGEYMSFGFALNLDFSVPVDGSNDVTISQALAAVTPQTIASLPLLLENFYLGSISIDRLWLKGGNDWFEIEAGIVRLARGYGYSFSPIDFFNTRNPLDPEAPRKGKLAFITTFYPMPLWKIELFSVAPDNLIQNQGWGFNFGAATIFSLGKVNFEFLYNLVLPEIKFLEEPANIGYPEYSNNDFTQILGFSLKADIEVGLFVDAIYRFEHRAFRTGEWYGKPFYGYEGLQAAIGVDYTIAGKVYLLLEYMFYGSGMLDWWNKDLDSIYDNSFQHWTATKPLLRIGQLNQEKKLQTFLRHDYIFGLVRVKINDYVSAGASYLFGADDQSAVLQAFAEIEPVNAFSIKVMGLLPLDWHMIDQSKPVGEFGSTNIGLLHSWSVTASVRF
jgi:hypothetical protein